jgi:hypothetical protein
MTSIVYTWELSYVSNVKSLNLLTPEIQNIRVGQMQHLASLNLTFAPLSHTCSAPATYTKILSMQYDSRLTPASPTNHVYYIWGIVLPPAFTATSSFGLQEIHRRSNFFCQAGQPRLRRRYIHCSERQVYGWTTYRFTQLRSTEHVRFAGRRQHLAGVQ